MTEKTTRKTIRKSRSKQPNYKETADLEKSANDFFSLLTMNARCWFFISGLFLSLKIKLRSRQTEAGSAKSLFSGIEFTHCSWRKSLHHPWQLSFWLFLLCPIALDSYEICLKCPCWFCRALSVDRLYPFEISSDNLVEVMSVKARIVRATFVKLKPGEILRRNNT